MLVAAIAQGQMEPIRPPFRIKPPQIILPPSPEKGQPMQLRELNATARISGLQVEVTTTLVFFNPNSRMLEGELEFPLPDGAAVTGYALDIQGKMVDGVVVKKEKARVAFETEVRRGVDPGIVEQTAGNVYRTRIYPLPPMAERKIRLRYIAELPADKNGDVAWWLPMPREQISKVAIRVEVAQGAVKPEIGGFGNLKFQSFENLWVASTELVDVKPGEDLWVSLPKLPAQVSAIERSPDGEVYFAISALSPTHEMEDSKLMMPRRLGIAWDASGSRSGDHIEKELSALKELLRKWSGAQVTLLVFRDRVEPPQTFTDVNLLIEAIKKAPLDGGTDLTALGKAIQGAEKKDQWILVTDGMDTLSDQLPDFGNAHVTALVSQPVAQRELLRQVCAASGGGVVELQRLSAEEAAEEIVRPGPRLVAVRGSGVTEVQGLGSKATGRVAIHGKLSSDTSELILEFSNGRTSTPIKLDRKNAGSGTVLAEAWAARRVNQLSVRAEENQDELLALGQRFGLVSPVTSLIVLESVDQYVRHDIEPPKSQPQWREQWLALKSTRSKDEQAKRASKIERVLAMWNERTRWWEKDFNVPADFSVRAKDKSPQSPYEARDSRRQMTERLPATDAPRNNLALSDQDRLRGGTASRSAISGTVTVNGFVAGKEEESSAPPGQAQKSISVQAWNPSTPYLAVLKGAAKADRYRVYLEQRRAYEHSPAFFVDCSDYFFAENEKELGARILSNLAEMKLEDAGVLRVMAWRFQQAGDLDRAVVLLRKAGKLRPEEPQSLRDLALALAERGKQAQNPGDLSESMSLFEKILFGDWQRFEEIEVTALEELNALIAWVKGSPVEGRVKIPSLDSRLLVNHDVDVRIVMSWDADNTDVDLHVVEPTGEEACYSQNRTAIGGLVSRDFTQGYGPEEYMVRRAKSGHYKIFAHYFGSHQQTVIGPCTITATVFTDFGRPNEKKQTLTLRLDTPRDRADIGEIQIGAKDSAEGKGVSSLGRDAFRKLRPGQTSDEVLRALGEPQRKEGPSWTYVLGNRQYQVQFTDAKAVKTVSELLPGGVVLILVQ